MGAVRRGYTPQVVDTALLTLALAGGNSKEAHARLKANGIDVPDSTLRDWRSDTHADRYLELCHTHAPEIEKRVIQASQEIQQRALAGSLLAVDEAVAQLEAGEAKDPSAVAKNLALTHGIITDKSLLLQGRPTAHLQTTDARDLIGEIRRDLSAIPGTAEEIHTDALSAGSDSANARD